METNINPKLPELNLRDFNKASEDLLLFSLKDLVNNFETLLYIPHRLNFYMVLLIQKGNCTFCIDGKIIDCLPGSFIPVSRGQIQNLLNFNDPEGYVLFFTENYISRYSPDLKWLNNLRLFRNTGDISEIKPVPDNLTILSSQFYTLNSEIKNGGRYIENEIVYHLFKIILLHSERMLTDCDTGNKADNENLGYLAEFKARLEENYCKNRSVKFYAGLLAITEKKLNRIVHDHFGKSAKKIIEERAIIGIKRQLLYSGFTTKEIGFQFGFKDPANFTRFFKVHVHDTPLHFRYNQKEKLFDNKTEMINNVEF